jgi:isocitrate lyase
MGTETAVVARTDAEAATLITSTIDRRDHPYILGSTNAALEPLVDVMDAAQAAGKVGEALQSVEDNWVSQANLKTFPEAVGDALKAAGKTDKATEFAAKADSLSLSEALKWAKAAGVDVAFDWESPRTREGYYRYQGGTKCGINRAVAYGPYADLLWMETKMPIYSQAKEFAEGVKSKLPWAKLAYNLSPSFNWDAAGMNDDQIKSYVWDLGKLGFVWQFITLAGFHSDALIADTFARAYATTGMLAYVNMVQRQEREHGVETLSHQKWSGANYVDGMIKTVQGGVASTAAMGMFKLWEG